MPPHYAEALAAARKELAEAIAELGEAQNRVLELEPRIRDLRHSVSVLAKLCGQKDIDVEEALGLTDAIRAAFCSTGKHSSMTAQDVRLRLETLGFDTKRYGNLLASIHTVIKRLEGRKEIRRVANKDSSDKPAYSITDQGVAVATMNTLKELGKMVSTFFKDTKK